MVDELLGEVVEVAVKGTSDAVTEVVAKRYGWRGCLAAVVIVVVLSGLLVWIFGWG